MKLVFFSVILNHHQAPVADEFYKLLKDDYCFVELVNLKDNKGATDDLSKRPYLLRAWESNEKYTHAMELAKTAECCVFAGIEALPFEKARLSSNLLSFDMGERWLKHGIKSFASPRLLRWLAAYWMAGWRHKPLYKLCCSAFCVKDHISMFTFKDKCYKWGYFTRVENYIDTKYDKTSTKDTSKENVSIMWCSRYLKLKHPELTILMANRLKKKGYKFQIDMYGSGEYEEKTKELTIQLGLTDVVKFHGSVSNDRIHEAMRQAEIFLFTSDQHEGWGAVANESLSEGCVLVASDSIGSSPYLINNGENGFMFHSSKTSCSFDNPDKEALNSLCERVEWLLNHPTERIAMQKAASRQMQEMWSPANAAKSLLQLIHNLQNGKKGSITDGPCSKA